MQSELGFLTNRDLFSNYYLEEHLPETDDWEAEDEDRLREVFDEIKELYEDEKGSFENYNESQLEKNFIRPVFEALGHVYEVEDDGGALVMSVDISYKPDEDDPRETDSYGRLAEDEFETYDAMVFTGLSDEQEALVRNFVPVAVDEAGGFAGFRRSATKNNSLVDRLEALTLPDVDATRDGLERYIDVKERADELDEKIEKTDALIDQIVYDLYGLTDEEIEIVEEAVSD